MIDSEAIRARVGPGAEAELMVDLVEKAYWSGRFTRAQMLLPEVREGLWRVRGSATRSGLEVRLAVLEVLLHMRAGREEAADRIILLLATLHGVDRVKQISGPPTLMRRIEWVVDHRMSTPMGWLKLEEPLQHTVLLEGRPLPPTTSAGGWSLPAGRYVVGMVREDGRIGSAEVDVEAGLETLVDEKQIQWKRTTLEAPIDILCVNDTPSPDGGSSLALVLGGRLAARTVVEFGLTAPNEVPRLFFVNVVDVQRGVKLRGDGVPFDGAVGGDFTALAAFALTGGASGRAMPLQPNAQEQQAGGLE